MSQNRIRKIVLGVDYKNGMSYEIGQRAYGGHTICNIIEEEDKYVIYIKDAEGYVKEWKSPNKNTGLCLEYDLEY